MSAQLVTFPVSGTAWEVMQGSELSINAQTYDGGSQGAIDALEGLRTAERRKAGRGLSYVITVTLEGAATIADYLTIMAAVYLGPDIDPEARAEGRACATAAARIDSVISARARALAIKPAGAVR